MKQTPAPHGVTHGGYWRLRNQGRSSFFFRSRPLGCRTNLWTTTDEPRTTALHRAVERASCRDSTVVKEWRKPERRGTIRRRADPLAWPRKCRDNRSPAHAGADATPHCPREQSVYTRPAMTAWRRKALLVRGASERVESWRGQTEMMWAAADGMRGGRGAARSGRRCQRATKAVSSPSCSLSARARLMRSEP